MKNILIYFLPLLITVTALIYCRPIIDSLFFNRAAVEEVSCNSYYPNLIDNPSLEKIMLSGTDSSGVIYIFGSSELSSSVDAHPYRFINSNFKNKAIAIGHAGNQCFSIYSQLLAH
jgi:poly-D-alanine transfer protein DltD